MSKSGDPSPSSPKKTSANKKASESKEKIAARLPQKIPKPLRRRLLSKKLRQGCRSGCGKGRRQARCGKKGPGKERVSGFCLQEGGAGRQKGSGKGS